ncbi:Primosome PriB/single-strand DNA-binding, putative [Theobroma cacao]|uniref:Primosome PriB/single-strand DNA-binding, putative n=1 Tax=Theobroma cacao TaxID=3641 RepID=A0A061FCZ9_THECC|nr:Primosome PriB/single-strand DNA-binding, putative [Theobroma cacao]
MIARRIRALILGSTSRFPLQNCTPFHSSAASNPRFSNSFVDDEEGGSAVYRLALKFQRPTTVVVQPWLRNHVSFIGTVDRPLRVMNTKTDNFGVHTLLNVKNPHDSDRKFKILLFMWNDMGKMCVKHVKPGDFIYVSGHLVSFSKVNEDGQLVICYQVNVKELNFVAQHGQRSTSQKYKELQSEQVKDVGEAGMERYERQLYLWQVFFTNPFEWWDNRKSKKNPRQPDFKHKDTGEALWLSPNDPPWIKKQLQLLDSNLAEGIGPEEKGEQLIVVEVHYRTATNFYHQLNAKKDF